MGICKSKNTNAKNIKENKILVEQYKLKQRTKSTMLNDMIKRVETMKDHQDHQYSLEQQNIIKQSTMLSNNSLAQKVRQVDLILIIAFKFEVKKKLFSLNYLNLLEALNDLKDKVKNYYKSNNDQETAVMFVKNQSLVNIQLLDNNQQQNANDSKEFYEIYVNARNSIDQTFIELGNNNEYHVKEFKKLYKSGQSYDIIKFRDAINDYKSKQESFHKTIMSQTILQPEHMDIQTTIVSSQLIEVQNELEKQYKEFDEECQNAISILQTISKIEQIQNDQIYHIQFEGLRNCDYKSYRIGNIIIQEINDIDKSYYKRFKQIVNMTKLYYQNLYYKDFLLPLSGIYQYKQNQFYVCFTALPINVNNIVHGFENQDILYHDSQNSVFPESQKTEVQNFLQNLTQMFKVSQTKGYEKLTQKYLQLINPQQLQIYYDPDSQLYFFKGIHFYSKFNKSCMNYYKNQLLSQNIQQHFKLSQNNFLAEYKLISLIQQFMSQNNINNLIDDKVYVFEQEDEQQSSYNDIPNIQSNNQPQSNATQFDLLNKLNSNQTIPVQHITSPQINPMIQTIPNKLNIDSLGFSKLNSNLSAHVSFPSSFNATPMNLNNQTFQKNQELKNQEIIQKDDQVIGKYFCQSENDNFQNQHQVYQNIDIQGLESQKKIRIQQFYQFLLELDIPLTIFPFNSLKQSLHYLGLNINSLGEIAEHAFKQTIDGNMQMFEIDKYYQISQVQTILITEIIARNIKNIIIFYYFNYKDNNDVKALENQINVFIQQIVSRKNKDCNITPLYMQCYKNFGFPKTESQFRSLEMDTELINARVINLLKQKFRVTQYIPSQCLEQYNSIDKKMSKDKNTIIQPIQYEYQVRCVKMKNSQITLFFCQILAQILYDDKVSDYFKQQLVKNASIFFKDKDLKSFQKDYNKYFQQNQSQFELSFANLRANHDD